MPWQAWSAFERDFNAAQGQLRTALDAYDTDYLTIRATVLEAFRQLAADSARRLGATGQQVPPDFEHAVVQEVLSVLPTPELLRHTLTLRFRVGVMLLGSEMLAEQRLAAQERRNLEAIESERRLAESQVVAQERAIRNTCGPSRSVSANSARPRKMSSAAKPPSRSACASSSWRRRRRGSKTC